jgi:hypothetical protein
LAAENEKAGGGGVEAVTVGLGNRDLKCSSTAVSTVAVKDASPPLAVTIKRILPASARYSESLRTSPPVAIEVRKGETTMTQQRGLGVASSCSASTSG